MGCRFRSSGPVYAALVFTLIANMALAGCRQHGTPAPPRESETTAANAATDATGAAGDVDAIRAARQPLASRSAASPPVYEVRNRATAAPGDHPEVRRLFLSIPDGDAPSGGFPVLFLLHGYGVSGEGFSHVCDMGARAGFVALCPDGAQVMGGGRFQWNRGAPALTHDLLRHTLDALDHEIPVRRDRAFVGGFSQGALHAASVAALHPDFWAGVLAIAPGGWSDAPVAGDGDLPPLYLMIGDGEPEGRRQLSDRVAATWSAAEAPILRESHPGGHHFPRDWAPRFTRALHWLHENAR